jgi:hypothetical protein
MKTRYKQSRPKGRKLNSGRKMFDAVTGFAMYEADAAENAYGELVDTRTGLGFDNPDTRDNGEEQRL